jgi:predicted amidohydrolase YtcJ
MSSPPSRELLLVNGHVQTFDPARPEAEAVAIRGDRIVAVGDLADARAAVAPSAQVLDLDGGLLVPGLRDAHVHPLYGGLDLLSCDLAPLPADPSAYVDRVAAHAAAHPELEWISGGGWAMTAFPPSGPTAEQLDRATGHRPAVLINRDRHGAWVNTAALGRAAITADTPDPGDGRIERDARGAPTGLLHEGATRLVTELMPAIDLAHRVRALRRAQQHLQALGITGWHDAIVGGYLGYPDPYDAYRELDRTGELTASVTGALWWDRHRGTEQVAELVERREQARRCRRFRATAVKIMVDGVVETRTASLLTPYCGEHHHRPESRFVPAAELRAAVAALDAADFRIHLHTIGDRSVRDALDAIAALPDPRRGRHQLAHVQVVDPADVPRFAALGVVANVQMLWACAEDQMTELTLPLLGTARASTQYPFRSLRRSGATLAAGSDWPVSTANPFAQIAVGVTRIAPEDPTSEPFLPGERLSLADAIAAFTAGAVWADHRDPDLGAVRVGARADLTAFDQNPYRLASHELSAVTATHTVVDGHCVSSSACGAQA